MDNIKRILACFLWFQTILDRLRQLHQKKKLGIEIVGPYKQLVLQPLKPPVFKKRCLTKAPKKTLRS